MFSVNDKVRFDPFETYTGVFSGETRGNYVIGRIVSINYKHKWFSVEYGCPVMRTSFNFCDIGNGVTVLGCI